MGVALLPARRYDIRSDKFSSQGGLRGLLSLDLPASRGSNMAFTDLANRRRNITEHPSLRNCETGTTRLDPPRRSGLCHSLRG